MKTEVLYRPSYSLAVVELAPGERMRAEAGAMVSMSAGVSLQTKAAGGFLASLKRSLLGGESFFMNEFAASEQGGTVTLAPAGIRDMSSSPCRSIAFWSATMHNAEVRAGSTSPILDKLPFPTTMG